MWAVSQKPKLLQIFPAKFQLLVSSGLFLLAITTENSFSKLDKKQNPFCFLQLQQLLEFN